MGAQVCSYSNWTLFAYLLEQIFLNLKGWRKEGWREWNTSRKRWRKQASLWKGRSENGKVSTSAAGTVYIHCEYHASHSICLLWYERVYLPLSEVADTPFHIQADELSPLNRQTHIVCMLGCCFEIIACFFSKQQCNVIYIYEVYTEDNKIPCYYITVMYYITLMWESDMLGHLKEKGGFSDA